MSVRTKNVGGKFSFSGDSDAVASGRIEGDALILVLRREIHRDNSRKLRDQVLGLIGKHLPRRLVLNLEQVPFMDSTGCAVLIEALRRMRACQGEIWLLALQPAVKGLLEIARLISLFKIATDGAELGIQPVGLAQADQ